MHKGMSLSHMLGELQTQTSYEFHDLWCDLLLFGQDQTDSSVVSDPMNCSEPATAVAPCGSAEPHHFHGSIFI